MTDLHETFEKYNEDFLKFERVVNPPSTRPDLCAFLLLSQLFPDTTDIISAAEHDQIYLDVDCEQLDKFSEETILTLTRCGVFYDTEVDSLSMFV